MTAGLYAVGNQMGSSASIAFPLRQESMLVP